YLDSSLFYMLISLFWMVKLHAILHSGAPSCLHKNAEPLVAVLRVFRDQGLQTPKCSICNGDHSFNQLSDTSGESQRSSGGRGAGRARSCVRQVLHTISHRTYGTHGSHRSRWALAESADPVGPAES